MNFLCLNHAQQLSELPLAQQRDVWLEWMKQAGIARNQHQWRAVMSLAGCAFELAWIGHGTSKRGMHVELTLSAICLANSLRELGDGLFAQHIIGLALERLGSDATVVSSFDCGGSVADCRSALKDQMRHQEFSTDDLNSLSLRGTAGSPQLRRHAYH